MTQEEKARAYDEALNKIKPLYEQAKKDGNPIWSTYEYLIPELTESEDERIRKVLVDMVKRETGFTGFPSQGQVLAYLEKQKENVEKEYVFRPSAGTDINTAVLQAIRRANEGDRLVLAFNGAYIPVRKGCNANKIVDIYDAFIEKQKEPHYTKRNALFDKCVENCDPAVMKKVSDEVDEMLEKEQKFTHHEVDESLAEVVTHQMEDDGDVDDFVRKGLDDVVLKYAGLGAKWQKEQKPAEWSDYKDKVNVPYCSSEPEWSEEDEERLKAICTYLQDYPRLAKINDVKRFNEYCDWLKSLRPQQKVEWNEEDEEIWFTLITFLKGYLQKYPPLCKDEETQVNRILNWLNTRIKSFRLHRHYKPTEEQMEALKNSAYGSYQNDDGPALRKLYEQLKKL